MIRKLAILNYILLIYSGLVKWFPGLPIDLTIAFAAMGLLFIPFLYSKKKIETGPKSNRIIVFSVIALSLLFLLTNIYTISQTYATSKSLAVILNIYSFIYPLVLFRKSDIPFVKKAMFAFTLVLLGILTYLYLSDQFIYFQMSEETLNQVLKLKNPIPNYLSLGTFMAVPLILFLTNRHWFILLIRGATIVMLFLLGGRGPLLFLPVIFVLYYFLHLNARLITFKNVIIGLAGIVAAVLFFDPSVIDFERFNLFENIDKDKSSLERMIFYDKGIEAAQDHLLFGQGIGSSGIILTRIDQIVYPHNLFLESIMETGIIGGILYFLLYFTLIRNTIILRKNSDALMIALVVIYLLFQDMKSGSFDAWRISLMWIAFFIIATRKTLPTKKIST